MSDDIVIVLQDVRPEVIIDPAGTQGPPGAAGSSGVAHATSPIGYDSGTQTVYMVGGVSVGQTWIWNGAAWALGTAGVNDAEYIVGSSNATLSAERVATAGSNTTWDFSTPGRAKVNVNYYSVSPAPVFNVLLGNLTGGSVTSGTGLTAIGDSALATLTSGVNNTIVGFGAGYGLTTGYENVAIGSFAMYQQTTANNCVAVGDGSLNGLGGSGQYNVALGKWALHACTSGVGNTGVGAGSGISVTTGTYNTLIGYNAGRVSLVTGSHNICIGPDAGSAWSGSNALFIDISNTATPLIGGDFAARTVTINGNTINTAAFQPSSAFQPSDAELTALAALVSAADKVPYFTGSGAAALTTLTSAARTLIAAVDAAAQRAALGLVIGTDVQAYDTELTALAALTSAADRIPYFTGSGTASLLTRDTDGTLAANSDTTLATQKAVKSYVDNLIGASNAMVYKGVIDCSSNPNYPAADAGHLYRISVAGKIGGVSGVNVEVGDTILCTLDGSASGDQATVGANWNVIQANIDGAVVGPATATDSNIALYNGSTGKIIKDTGIASSTLVLTSGSYSNPSWITGLAWSKISSTPTTLAGYGITDPIVVTSGSYANPSWITSLAWSKITTTPTTLAGYGITDAQALDATLTALAAQNWVANALPIGSGADTVAQVTFAANTFPARSSSGNLVAKTITDYGLSLVDDADATTARTTLGVVIGTDVQAYDATLSALAASNWAANAIPIGSGADTLSQVAFAANTFPARASSGNLVAKTITDFGLSLVDDASAAEARTTIGAVTRGQVTATLLMQPLC